MANKRKKRKQLKDHSVELLERFVKKKKNKTITFIQYYFDIPIEEIEKIIRRKKATNN